jgi:hypothetical protein
MRHSRYFYLFAFLAAFAASLAAYAQDFPNAEIGNGLIQAKLYLPDPVKGYYRATRFDWSGVIYSLQYKGHEYFGQWVAKPDPLLHESITGPAESFDTSGGGPGYADAKPGDTFIRIGVGVVEKPEEASFSPFRTYKVLDAGIWKVKKGKDWIEFSQTLRDKSGYAYVYTKRISLIHRKPQLVISHTLKNIGSKVIETTQFNHNFFMIDHLPSGPGITVRFPFELRVVRDFRGFLEARGRELVFLKGFEGQQSTQSLLEGFGPNAKDYEFAIENQNAGAGVRVTGDRPIVRLNFWTRKETVCPEPFVQMRIPPGKAEKWELRYEFYTLKK